VEQEVMKDRRITIVEIATEVGISETSVRTILHDHLEMRKLSAVWVPKLLGAQQKADRVTICEVLLLLQEIYGENFWRQIITVDECWLPYFNVETKQQSKEWRKKGEGPPVKARRAPSVGKVNYDYGFLGLRRNNFNRLLAAR
jgi:histone-lysine N-methyltransferase SETMAR